MAGLSGGWFAAGAFALGSLATRLLRRTRPSADAPGPESPDAAQSRARRRESGSVSDLRDSALLGWVAEQAARDTAVLRTLLADFRDALGADEAVFWRWSEERDALAPEIWSTDDAPRPAYFDPAEWAGLVQWSAQEHVVQLDANEPCRFAAAPLTSDKGFLGVLSVSAERGLGAGREAARSWLPRYAAQLYRTVHLCESRRFFGRRDRQRGALLAGVRAVQLASGTASQLGRAICDTALSATSGNGAALVRWDSAGGGGVQYTTQPLRRRVPFDVADGSLVEQACRVGVLIARELSGDPAESPVFFARDGVPERGSVAVLPIVRGERTLGAIVVWSDAPAISTDELEHVRTLGELSVGALEVTWSLEAIELKSKTDPLTGLGNRRYLEERLAQALAETDRFGQPTALILVDIDHFKRVNDTWGHEAGDHVLKKVARLLADGVREVDTCVRFGGEEIALLLPQTSVAGAADVADRLRRTLAARPLYYQSQEIPVTASFGVCAYPEAAATHEALLTEADRALYEAKHAGRNCVRSAPIRSRNAKA